MMQRCEKQCILITSQTVSGASFFNQCTEANQGILPSRMLIDLKGSGDGPELPSRTSKSVFFPLTGGQKVQVPNFCRVQQ